MTLLQKNSAVRDWLDLALISNLPTIVTDSLVGVAIGLSIEAATTTGFTFQSATIAVIFGMCALYTAGMVLNGIVDRDIDAVERPNRPIAAGRIRLPWAWTAFIVLMLLGFFLRPTFAATPIPVAVAALIGVWLLALADGMRSFMLRRLAKAWCAIAIIAAIWWAVDMMIKDPFDLTASGFDPIAKESIRIGHFALNAPVLLIALSLVTYNLLHKRTAFAIVFMALCRLLVPVAVAMSILVPSGTLGSLWTSGRVPFVESALILFVPPFMIAIHTVMLSIVARREISGDGAEYRCGRCSYPLKTIAPRVCPECGCNFAQNQPLGDRPLSKRMRRASPILAAMAIVPLVLIIAITISQLVASITLKNFNTGFASSLTSYKFFGLSGYMALPYWAVGTINISLATLAAVWFVIAATRAFRAAVSHPSRRPAGIAGLIAALALLDAASAAMLQATLISVLCMVLWFFTRWLQRRIAGS